MKQFKIRYQFYSLRASCQEEAIRKAVAMIKRDVDSFVVDAVEPIAEKSWPELGKMLITGK